MYLEELAKAVLDHLETDLEDKLDEVETYWSDAGDALSLPDVETWELAGNPEILAYPQSSLPVVVSMAQREGPSGDQVAAGRGLSDQSDQWGYGIGDALATVLWFVASDDPAIAAKYGWRYAKAIVMVLRDHERIETGMRIQNFIPRIEVDPPRPEYPDTGGAYYSVMGQIDFAVKVVHKR